MAELKASHHHSYHFLILCLAGSIALVYFVLQPILSPLILAAVFAFLFYPVYVKLLKYLRGRQGLAALFTTLLFLLLILLPISLLGIRLVRESAGLYEEITRNNSQGIITALENGYKQTLDFAPVLKNIDIQLNQYLQWGLDALLQNIGTVFTNAVRMILYSMIFIVAFYFLLKEGHKLKEYFFAITPLKDKDNHLILARLQATVSSVIRGSLVIGIIQGIVACVGFFLFGVPHALLWGSITVVSSLIPGLGTALVIGPAIVFLFITGKTIGAIGLLVWGVLAVGLIDNFLGPKLVGQGMHMHPFIVFIMVIGGLIFFGPLGFLFGPLAMILCLTLIDIYSSASSTMKT